MQHVPALQRRINARRGSSIRTVPENDKSPSPTNPIYLTTSSENVGSRKTLCIYVQHLCPRLVWVMVCGRVHVRQEGKVGQPVGEVPDSRECRRTLQPASSQLAVELVRDV